MVREAPGEPALIYIDRHLIHEVTSAQAFAGLEAAGTPVRRPDLTFAVMDHSVPTKNRYLPVVDQDARLQFEALERNCKRHGILLFDMASRNQGIVHIIGPELGITQPGLTIVCGDSHTSTHGAFGALAFGIGTSEVEHVLATQCLQQSHPRPCTSFFRGKRPAGVSSKDLILALIGKIGISGGTDHVIEYARRGHPGPLDGSAHDRLQYEHRGGARAGMVAPDETTFAYLEGRPFVPVARSSRSRWKNGARFAAIRARLSTQTVELDAAKIAPQITWGTNPGMVTSVTDRVPDPGSFSDPDQQKAAARALEYMALRAGTPMVDIPVDRVFIGSCTNARMEDLRAAAGVVRGKHVARTLKAALVVPGSRV